MKFVQIGHSVFNAEEIQAISIPDPDKVTTPGARVFLKGTVGTSQAMRAVSLASVTEIETVIEALVQAKLMDPVIKRSPIPAFTQPEERDLR